MASKEQLLQAIKSALSVKMVNSFYPFDMKLMGNQSQRGFVDGKFAGGRLPKGK